MPAAPADSAIYRRLLSEEDSARLFSDSAELRAMLLVEGALAQVQGQLGLIPADAAAFINRAALEVQLDPSALAAETAINGVPVPGFVAAFRNAMNAPDFAQYVHWGATSQDIMETALILRLRQLTTLWQSRLSGLLCALATLAQTHADLPVAARTYGQVATPGSFGALVADWGMPILRHSARLDALRPDLLVISLGGAAGTLSAMGPKGPEVRAGLAQALGLGDPGGSWHSQRDRIAAFAGWMAGLAASLGKIGEDLILMSQSGIAEVRLAGAGGSSTMPQKQNPVAPSALVALSRHAIGLAGMITAAGLHRQSRDGAAWFGEWLCLPQLCITLARAMEIAENLAQTLTPLPGPMAALIEDPLGLIHAEALSFALADSLPRPQAQARVKALCAEASATQTALVSLVQRDFPGRDWPALLSPAQQMGEAPAIARRFATAARAAVGTGEHAKQNV